MKAKLLPLLLMLLISSILSIAQNVKFDGVIVSNLAATDIGSVVVDDLYVQCQAFTTDGTKYDLLSASLSVEDGGENIHLWLYAALSDGKIDVAGGALVTFGAPSLVSGSVYQFTPSIPSSFTLQANTTYWLVFNAAASPNDASINFTTDMSSLGPGTIPSSNTYAESADGGSSYTYGDGLPSMFSIFFINSFLQTTIILLLSLYRLSITIFCKHRTTIRYEI